MCVNFKALRECHSHKQKLIKTFFTKYLNISEYTYTLNSSEATKFSLNRKKIIERLFYKSQVSMLKVTMSKNRKNWYSKQF